MPFAISQNYKLAVNRETVWGTPVTTGAKFLRITDASFKPEYGNIESNEINAVHRESSGTIRVSSRGSGQINGELTYDTYDPLFESVMGAAFTGAGTRTLKVGNTVKSLTFQEQYGDLTNNFILYPGSLVPQMGIDVQIGQIIRVSATVASRNPVIGTATAIGTVGAANTNPVIDPIAGVQLLQEGGVSLSGVQQLSIQIQNDLIEIPSLGSVDPAALYLGRVRVTGNISVFKQDAALLTKLVNNTLTSLAITLGGVSTKRYAITLPKVKFTTVDGGAGGSNPIIERFAYSAEYDATDSSMKIVATD